MPQFTIPLRFYVEYFYDRTNVSELKKEAKTPPDIHLNSIYDLIRYGLMNPITSQCGVHYMLLGAKADTYHITVIEGQEQTISIANKFPNHVIITYHCNPIHDFICLLYLYPKIVHSESLLKQRKEELESLIFRRIPRHKEYYLKNAGLCNAYKFVLQIFLNLRKSY